MVCGLACIQIPFSRRPWDICGMPLKLNPQALDRILELPIILVISWLREWFWGHSDQAYQWIAQEETCPVRLCKFMDSESFWLDRFPSQCPDCGVSTMCIRGSFGACRDWLSQLLPFLGDPGNQWLFWHGEWCHQPSYVFHSCCIPIWGLVMEAAVSSWSGPISNQWIWC